MITSNSPFRAIARNARAINALAISALVLSSAITHADVKLPLLFSDHMVLQQDIKIPVWGWADPGEGVQVTFGGKTVATQTGKDGKWRVDLKNIASNATPQTLTVKGKNTIKLEDVLVGDVWVCSGQSNMGRYLGEDYRASEEVPKANDPLLRLFSVSEATAIEPAKDVTNPPWGKQWKVCNPDEAIRFTAVGYYFGKELREKLNRPIGLISAPYGGTMAQGWLTLAAIEKNVAADPEFKEWLEKRAKRVQEYPQRAAEYPPLKAKYETEIRRWNNEVAKAPEYLAKLKDWEEENAKAIQAGKPPLPKPQPSEPRPKDPETPEGGRESPFMVGNYYNAMIAPLMPYAIKGAIWYQGESNSGNSKQYRTLFPLLINDWRERWGQGNFPFLFVQLPNIKKPATQPVQETDLWPGLREAQALTLSVPNTGMATIIDVGDPYDVHGKDKFHVGTRLALVARHVVYGENIVYSGPTYGSMKVAGNKIEITFKNTGTGLEIGTAPWTPSGKIPPVAKELKGFAIAGEDKNWFGADARIAGNSVIVESPQVPHPVAVRYGWADNPPCNLYNKEKLPAAPFRTDNW